MKKNKFTIMAVIPILVLLMFVTGCFPPGKDGPYKGRVVDAETGMPLEGVVVLGVWYSEATTAGGAVGKYYDAQETVTDTKGEFEIRGQGWQFTDNIFSSISEMHVMVFKAGYSYVGSGMWSSLKLDGGLMMEKVAWEGDRAIIPIRKLTMEERKKRLFDKEIVPDEKQRLMIKEVNRERLFLGLDLYEEVK